MRRPVTPLVLTLSGLLAALLLAGCPGKAQEAEAQAVYVGVERCGKCHDVERRGNQLQCWRDGPHAWTYKTLLSSRAREVAAPLGIEQPGQAPECLRCHLTEHGIDPALIDPGYERALGVGCESCHGPGSRYGKYAIMKDHGSSVAHGLWTVDRTTCERCHNASSPTFEGFDYEEARELIEHPVPGKPRSGAPP